LNLSNLQATEFNDQDFRIALERALKMVLIFGLVGLPIVWVALGWQSAVFFLVGAAIAATGIFEWKRLMGAVLERLQEGAPRRPLAPVMVWFTIRLLLTGAVLYVSLRSLHGSVYAVVAGIALAFVALIIESFRLLKVWTL
jgi:hypothetical protein